MTVADEAPIKLILINPRYDSHTQITSAWASDIHKDVPVYHRLEGEQITPDQLRSILADLNGPALIAFYGHGTEEELLAHQSENTSRPLIGIAGVCVLPAELSSHRIYAVACLAGSKLGPALQGASCEFIGYKDDFAIATAFEDRFKSIVNQALIDWANGQSVKEVWSGLSKAWKDLAETMRSTRTREQPVHMSFRTLAAAFALFNRKSLMYFST